MTVARVVKMRHNAWLLRGAARHTAELHGSGLCAARVTRGKISRDKSRSATDWTQSANVHCVKRRFSLRAVISDTWDGWFMRRIVMQLWSREIIISATEIAQRRRSLKYKEVVTFFFCFSYTAELTFYAAEIWKHDRLDVIKSRFPRYIWPQRRIQLTSAYMCMCVHAGVYVRMQSQSRHAKERNARTCLPLLLFKYWYFSVDTGIIDIHTSF